ncbi:MAG TPA: Wzz/FepE/Etk N-terminal domain-containing protein, partial [Solirubrobacterales bacterium]|nr:Wzz/FepE/Etk N-terminal domain-containing protein [Solirubrobacterales bacterium]
MQFFTTMQEGRREGPDLRRWGRVVWRRKWLLLGVVVAIPAAVYLGSSLLPKTYESSTTLYVQPTSVSSTLFSNQLDVATSDAGEAATLIETTVVARRAARVLGQSPSTARELLGHVSVTSTNVAEPQNHFLTIAAQASSPIQAARIANAFATAVAVTRTVNAVRGIGKTLATLESQAGETGDRAAHQALAQQLQNLRGLRASQKGTTPVVEPAAPSRNPISPKPLRNAAIALFLALLIAAGLAALLDRLDRRLQEVDELEELAGAPLLGVVPFAAFPGNPPGPHVRESFQTLRAGLTYFNVDRALPTVMV